jgi:hypothetical protein
MAAKPLVNFVSGASAALITGIKSCAKIFRDDGVRGLAYAVIMD